MKSSGSITTIGWILIARPLLRLILLDFVGVQQHSASNFTDLGYLIQVVLGVVVFVVLGAAILAGLNWGRVSYLFYTPAWIIYNAAVQFIRLQRPISVSIIEIVDYTLVLEMAFYVVILILMTRPSISAYYTHQDSEAGNSR
jgi:hypothetical protein